MQKPAPPPDEARRIAALHRIGILDTPPDERFDRVTRTAQRLFGTPIALISLVDTDRQWFKACLGLDVRETGRDISFCGHAILGSDVLVIEDTLTDTRFADNPLVTGEPHIRFYAGQPLSARDGSKMGTLCIIDRTPRQFSVGDRLALAELATWAECELHAVELGLSAGSILDNEARLRAVLESVLDGIVILDIEGAIRLINPAAEQLFGCHSADIIGHRFDVLLPEPHRTAYRGYLNAYRQSGRPQILGSVRETAVIHRDGSIIPVDLGISEAVIDGQFQFIATVRDIRERKEIERMKSELVSVVSHELRTPLTAIKGSLGLIAGGIAGELSDQARHLIDIAHKSSERLTRLINDILDIEKIESGRMEFRQQLAPLMPIVEHAVEANQAFCAQFGVQLAIKFGLPGIKLMTDPDRLTQVLTNLISNAAKFSPAGSEVAVSVARRGQRLHFEVSDEGPGIPPAFQERIFQKFAQADSTDTRGKSGTGLGLSISKAIVERLGGSIGFQTQAGVGTTFFFDLRAWHERMPILDDPGPGPRVLIIEDSRHAADLIKAMLKAAGYAADIAYSAAQAKMLLSGGGYDALTLDLVLPDQDGVSLLRELRELRTTRDLPVVVVSVMAREVRDEVNGGAVAVADWLDKPVDGDRLVAAMRHALRHGGPTRPRVLHVDDDDDLRQVVAALLDDSADLVGAANLADARARLEHDSFDLIVLDVALPDGSGLELLPQLRRQGTPVVAFSAQALDASTARDLRAALVKSQMSYKEFADQVRSLLPAASA